MLVHNSRRDIRVVADSIWYPIWDTGVGLDHSVRTPDEAATAIAEGKADGARISAAVKARL